MLKGVRRVFFVSNIKNELLPHHQSRQVHPPFWSQSSLTSLQPARLPIFFVYRNSIKINLNKLQVALCLFSFGVFSFLKAMVLVCPLIVFISNFVKNILDKIYK